MLTAFITKDSAAGCGNQAYMPWVINYCAVNARRFRSAGSARKRMETSFPPALHFKMGVSSERKKKHRNDMIGEYSSHKPDAQDYTILDQMNLDKEQNFKGFQMKFNLNWGNPLRSFFNQHNLDCGESELQGIPLSLIDDFWEPLFRAIKDTSP